MNINIYISLLTFLDMRQEDKILKSSQHTLNLISIKGAEFWFLF